MPSPPLPPAKAIPRLLLLLCASLLFGHLWFWCSEREPLAHPARVGLIHAGRKQDPVALLASGLVLPSPWELARTPVASRLDWPLGAENGALTYNARAFGEVNHLGDDFNGIGGENSDLGEPVYAVGSGQVVYAANPSEGWGNVLLLQHRLPDGRLFQSFYGHLDSTHVTVHDQVHRGQVIGTVGTANGKYFAHLHFEIRDSISVGAGTGYHALRLDRKDPTSFLQEYRQRAELDLLPALEAILRKPETGALHTPAGPLRMIGAPENHGNEGHAAVASVRTWRDSHADTPWPLAFELSPFPSRQTTKNRDEENLIDQALHFF